MTWCNHHYYRYNHDDFIIDNAKVFAKGHKTSRYVNNNLIRNNSPDLFGRFNN